MTSPIQVPVLYVSNYRTQVPVLCVLTHRERHSVSTKSNSNKTFNCRHINSTCHLKSQNNNLNRRHFHTTSRFESEGKYDDSGNKYDDSDDEFIVEDDDGPIPGEHPNDPVPGRDLYDPVKGQLVYHGTLENLVKHVKRLSVFTSAVIIAVQPFIFKSILAKSLGLQLILGSCIGFFALVTTALVHLVTRKYVRDMYYDKHTHMLTASTFTFLCGDRVHKFSTDDVCVHDLPKLFTYMTYSKVENNKINHVPLYIDPFLLRNKDVYVRIMQFHLSMDPFFKEERRQILDKVKLAQEMDQQEEREKEKEKNKEQKS